MVTSIVLFLLEGEVSGAISLMNLFKNCEENEVDRIRSSGGIRGGGKPTVFARTHGI